MIIYNNQKIFYKKVFLPIDYFIYLSIISGLSAVGINREKVNAV